MGNQQAKLDKQLSWFGGILDGEGCFHMSLQKRKWNTADGVRNGLFARPMIKLTNTYKDGLDTVVGILKEYKIAHYIHWRKPQKKTWKRSWDVSIVGLRSCLRFCALMKDYVVWKKEELEAMMEFLESRLSRKMFYHTRGANASLRPKYNKKELDCISKLRGRDSRLHDIDKILAEAYLNASTTTR